MTIPVTIVGHAIVAIMAILTVLAIMARLDMAMDMVVIGVYAKSKKNVDQPWKRNWKKCIGWKVMAKKWAKKDLTYLCYQEGLTDNAARFHRDNGIE